MHLLCITGVLKGGRLQKWQKNVNISKGVHRGGIGTVDVN